VKTESGDAWTKPKSQMLADLLDRKDTPMVNGVIGEKGLELVEKAILSDKPLSNNNNKDNGVVESSVCENRTSSALGEESTKRPAAEESDAPAAKKIKTEEVEGSYR